jgi:glycerol-3-phosphate dehydrogenase
MAAAHVLAIDAGTTRWERDATATSRSAGPLGPSTSRSAGPLGPSTSRSAGPLGPWQREAAWQAAATRVFDVVVIGGGVVGCGCALDAASRGLSVLLVEQRDLASGTSSRSSKLIHGGLRYLEHREVRLVFEALRERSLMLTRLAPHLVSPLELVLPLHRAIVDRVWLGGGVAVYDALAHRRSNPLPRHRHLSRQATLARVPALAPEHITGAIRFWDAQVDDARLTVAVARTAAAHGAHILTSARVTGFERDAGRVAGVHVVDVERPDQGPRVVRARVVVNATGVWSDEVASLASTALANTALDNTALDNTALDNTSLQNTVRGHVRASKGVHLVVPRDRIDSRSALILRTASSVLFVLPWGDRWIIGTTDTDWHFDRAHPAATRTDIEYLLSELNRALRHPISTADVVGVYAGLRPLLAGESEHTSTLSREHAVFEPAPGLVSVAGGKLTTYRVMARDTIDRAASSLGGAGGRRTVGPSATADLPLVGADGWSSRTASADAIARDHDLSTGEVRRLLGRYGSQIDDVLGLARRDARLRRPVEGGAGVLGAEVVYAATHEGALHVDDVLARRTHLSIETADRGTVAASHVARLLAPLLGWDDARRDREVERYAARVDAERASQRLPDDASADAARLAVADPRAT